MFQSTQFIYGEAIYRKTGVASTALRHILHGKDSIQRRRRRRHHHHHTLNVTNNLL
jgi:hypothetical protein